ncbi:MAG: extracellular matrix regulator RemB [Vulcanibacillus sp.]
MFIHIGGERVLKTKDIIIIINANDINLKKNSSFLEYLEKGHQIEKIKDQTKSFIITVDKIYYSPISSLTLSKRANNY